MDYLLNIEPSPEDNRDYNADELLPTMSVDRSSYSLASRMTPIRNQGSQGTCAAMTAAAIKEYQENKNVGFDNYFSPQFVYNNRSNETSGMHPRDVMKILNKKGICEESTYPYNTFDPISPATYHKAKKNRIDSYGRLFTVNAVKQALKEKGPCLIAVPVYNYGLRMWKSVDGEPMRGGHAMTIIGWNAEGFIIRNSWGPEWGLKGHTVFPYDDWGHQWEAWTSLDMNNKSLWNVVAGIIDDIRFFFNNVF